MFPGKSLIMKAGVGETAYFLRECISQSKFIVLYLKEEKTNNTGKATCLARNLKWH
jgi:hypothetical protein